MGLAVVRGGISMFMQCLCQRLFFIGQSRELLAVVQFLVVPLRASAQPFGQIRTGWILPRKDARATRRADVACRVGIVEKHAFVCQLVDRRSFIELAAVATHVPLSKIVDKKEDHIELWLCVQFNAGCQR